MSKFKNAAALSVAVLMAGHVWAAGHQSPDPTLAPGVDNPAVTQANLGDTICKPGWTKPPVRPPTSYTNALKKQQLANWGYDDKDMTHYEEDHRIPLEVGGHPSDPQNLWPEPYGIDWNARVKDKLENFVKREICAGRMTLSEGRAIFKGDWVEAFKVHCGGKPEASCSHH